MPYTTGEMARICDVSVRTVQYYDKRGILAPCELSEGGRRLYSEDDLEKMKLICFLRELDFSLDDIARIMKESNSKAVISLILVCDFRNTGSIPGWNTKYFPSLVLATSISTTSAP